MLWTFAKNMVSAVVIADDDSLVGNLEVQEADLLISLGDLWNSTIEKVAGQYLCDQVVAVRGQGDNVWRIRR